MRELFDVVDINGQPTGEIVERSQAHAEGIRHRTAHVWIVRKHGDRMEALLQKRTMDKDSFPGCFDTSSAGHIQAGDEPQESALRELKEELGIVASADDLEFAGMFQVCYDEEFHGKMFRDRETAFVYVYKKEVDVSKLILQAEEVEAVEWFDLERIYEACKNDDPEFCVPSGGLKTVMNYLGT